MGHVFPMRGHNGAGNTVGYKIKWLTLLIPWHILIVSHQGQHQLGVVS